MIIPVLGGVLYALGFPMKTLPEFFILPIIGMSLFLSSLNLFSGNEVKLSDQIIKTLLFSFGYCISGYYWIPYTINEFGEIPFPINWMLGIFFSLIIAPQIFVFIFSLRLIEKIKKLNHKTHQILTQDSTYLILLAFLLTIFEYYTPQQFPAHLGHPWIQIQPLLGLAPLFGAPIYSFISYLLALVLCYVIQNKKLHVVGLSASLILILVSLLMPLKKNLTSSPQKTNMRLVQANIGNFLKISAEGGSFQAIQEVLNSYYELSTENIKKPLDLIVWPETAYPHLLNSKRMKDSPGYIPKVFKDTIYDSNAELFVGGYDFNSNQPDSFESEFNTAFHFGQNARLKEVYHKMKLIPFGENLPFGVFNQYIGSLIKNISFFARGKRYTLFKTKSGTPFISAICYEILFSSFIRNYLNGTQEQASFLINLTNDSWYGDTSEPFQHLSLAKWRAMEFDIPIVRMTNTGITSVLFADGSESQRLNVGEKKKLDIQLYTKSRSKTLFQRIGLLGFFLVFLMIFSISYFIGEQGIIKI